MSTDYELKWEWPAERQAQQKLMLSVEEVKSVGKGLFGIGASPSIAENLPDPIEVIGKVTQGDESYLNKTIRLTLPTLELGEVAKGDSIMLGLVENHTCICIKKSKSASSNLSELDC